MPPTHTSTFAVLGAGSWGTALAMLLARNGHPTRLWGRNAEQMESMSQQRCNQRYLPDISLPEGLSPTADLTSALSGVENILIAVPSHAFRSTLKAISPHITDTAKLAWATKGLEPGSKKLLHEIFIEELGSKRNHAVISGPTFAKEVALHLPTAVTVASNDADTAKHFAACLHNNSFRAYTSDDVIGVEIGGAVKNVLALAAGIADGLGFGANTRAALITRGLAEMMRLGVALGGQQETFMGLAGLGDLVLTCTDNQSRNRRIGLALGQGQSLEQAIARIEQVVEGVRSAPEISELAHSLGIDMPIIEQVHKVLCQKLKPQTAVEALLARDQKAESS
ncbi:MAG: NAD(P)-dependent glycerol-3-phosphate dehydrogenase [Gammaproteobacteria bacterium]|nr:NAD(P)-dependent glycerol-3-phosphate dehydrogenase [Gammaproteobacteria bacterium]